MKRTEEKWRERICSGIVFIIFFLIWTALIQMVDVRPWGQNGTDIGFAAFNLWFHRVSGVHMWIYTVTDWLGLVPIAICFSFGILGLFQFIKRKNLIRVDHDLIILGVYYVVVMMLYLVFEEMPINYRPVLIEGVMEGSYPSSTTLLVMCVMPAFLEQMNRRMNCKTVKRAVQIISILFMSFMVVGRSIAGVHWFTDIIGAILLSAGLYMIYSGCVKACNRNMAGRR